ncbi:ribonuclease H-like domain-containing protein [Tanacetum coccineum]
MAIVMVLLQTDVELKDNIVVAMPKIARKGFYTCNIRVEYEWKPPRCACCKVFSHFQEECPKNIGAGETKNLKKPSQTLRGVSVGPKVGFKPAKQVFQPVSKKPTANTSGNKKKNVEPTKEVSKSNPFDVLNLVENDVDLGTNEGTSNLASQEANFSGSLFLNVNSITFVDDVGKPLKKVDSSGDYDSEDVVASVDNEMASFFGEEGWLWSSQVVFLPPRKLFAYVTGGDVGLTLILYLLIFFDSFDVQTPKSSHYEGRATPNDEGSAPNTPNNSRNVSEGGTATSMGSKWVFKIKYKASGEIERYIARLVAKGFTQREVIDYDGTFSHVVKMTTVRCLINIVVQKDWPLFQLDVNNAVLHGDLCEDVYMTLPPGFYANNDNKVCKLNKSLYGLKQAPRQWNAKLVSALTDHRFVQSELDYSVFVKASGNTFVALLVYVDDIVITKSDVKQIEYFKEHLKSKFQIKDLGLLKYFLGIEALRNDNGVCLT